MKFKSEGIFSLVVRVITFLIWVSLQIALVYVIGKLLNIFAVYAYWLIQILGIFLILVINNGRDNPSYKISWTILMLLLPLLGVFVYLSIKGGFKVRKIIERHESHKTDEKKYLIQNNEYLKNLENDNIVRFNEATLLEKLSGYPLYENTEVKYLHLGEVYFEKMMEEIKKAKKFIYIEYFIVAEGEMWQDLFEVLAEKAKEGVDVRLIVDQIGSISVLPKNFVKTLESNNIKIILFNQLKLFVSLMLNYRDHRKITVIDGNVAFNGGINIGDEYINKYKKHGHWKDVGVMLRGEAVFSFTIMFLKMWDYLKNSNEEKDMEFYKPSEKFQVNGFVIPYDDSPINKYHSGRNLYLNIISSSQKYLYITTPYLIIDDEIINVLCLAAYRGIDVKIITPYIPDKKFVKMITKSNYGELLEAGVEIYEYKPGFIHAKTFVSDDSVAVVGSINMDFRSFYLQFECATWMYKVDAVKEVYDDFMDTLRKSEKITYESWKSRSMLCKIFESILKLFSPLM